jgi:phosphoglycolate phosphatase-like HAD superfamily hydrolase
MNKPLQDYKTLVFDCDGVVLNSNKIKTQAFYEVARPFGCVSAQAMVDYHVKNGGISRYAKFEYFITQILQQPFEETLNKNLLKRFSKAVKHGLMNCEIAEGLDHLKAQIPNANWLIVSGGDQQELRDVFSARDLLKYFEGGIFGSPDTKDIILAKELKNGNISRPALFLGDSKYDYEVAKTAELDFVFLTQWSEVKDHQAWCHENNLKNRLRLRDIGCEHN